MKIIKLAIITGSLVTLLGIAVGLKTYFDILPISELGDAKSAIQVLQVVDRNNSPLSVSYQNRWNSYDYVPLHKIPKLLQDAFILSEDQHFYSHNGLDWNARAMAVWQAVRLQKVTRGASTISEQVVRMLHPRPRTLWSKWIETFEVSDLEEKYSKSELFEFYLNQIPYASNRLGVVQAANFYFNRDLSTLSVKEMLALVVLARAPSRYDLYKNVNLIEGGVLRLALRLKEQNKIDDSVYALISTEKIELQPANEPVNVSHFLSFIRSQTEFDEAGIHEKIQTTIDSQLQRVVQGLVDQRLKSLAPKGVQNGAALVVDHQTGEIMAWVVAGANDNPEVLRVPSHKIDAVTALRQPASTFKPFLYALALEKGWSPATVIKDTPLADVIGEGYHRFRNYSNSFHGNVTLRQALGNSFNIPALRTIKFTGVAPFYEKLHALGFSSLKQKQEFYDEGLALGNGEVSLFELVRAYATLANKGNYRELRYLLSGDTGKETREVFSKEASSLIANILSDPKARQMEFGSSSVLNLPVQTAVKTGTSNDYHDAWSVGFNYRYVVGIWMGNLDRTPTDGVTGGIGPALTMRSIFAELTRNEETKPLYLSPLLVKADVCVDEEDPCKTQSEFFMSDPSLAETQKKVAIPNEYAVTLPVPDMQVAIDPRIPRENQKLPIEINQLNAKDRVEWRMNGRFLEITGSRQVLWPLAAGRHKLEVAILHSDNSKTKLSPVEFTVK